MKFKAEDKVLDVKDLHTSFYVEKGIVKAVRGVSFDLHRNQTLGIVGESGCGKSITAMSIMRLIPSPPGKIDKGEIFFREGDDEFTDIALLDPKGSEMRKIRGGKIGMIFQEPMTSLNPLYTIGDQISETLLIHKNISKKEAMELSCQMLEKVKISEPRQRLKEYPHLLSGGMRQRIMIAMALSCNPSILIADEPTTALDVTIQSQILNLMRELKEEYNSGIILITHNLGVVSQMSDNIMVMYFGRVMEMAETNEVFLNPLHQYTKGLIQSVPVFGKKSGEKLFSIDGLVPGPFDEVMGCAFADRCRYCQKRCREEEPDLVETEPNHFVRCFAVNGR